MNYPALDMEVPFENWIVVGLKGSGKSDAACWLLSRFVGNDYSVLYLNFKTPDIATNTGPSNLDELSLVMTIGAVESRPAPTYCARLGDLEALFRASREPIIVYAEPDPQTCSGAEAESRLFDMIPKKRKLVVCLDEVVNHFTSRDEFGNILANHVNQDRTHERFYVLIHQHLKDIEDRITGSAGDYSYLFVGPQFGVDSNSYEQLIGNCHKSFNGYSVWSGGCDNFPSYRSDGDVVVITRAATGLVRPISIGLPSLSTLEDFNRRVKNLRENRPSWGDRVS